jgi:hypothetical protein
MKNTATMATKTTMVSKVNTVAMVTNVFALKMVIKTSVIANKRSGGN